MYLGAFCAVLIVSVSADRALNSESSSGAINVNDSLSKPWSQGSLPSSLSLFSHSEFSGSLFLPDSMASLALNLTSSDPSKASNASSSFYDLPSSSNGRPTCDSKRFGSDLVRFSCYQAWRRIKPTSTVRKVAQRGRGVYAEGYLPFRWLGRE